MVINGRQLPIHSRCAVAAIVLKNAPRPWQPCFVMPAIRTAVQGPFNCERVQLVLISGNLQVDSFVKFRQVSSPTKPIREFWRMSLAPWWSTVSLKSKRWQEQTLPWRVLHIPIIMLNYTLNLKSSISKKALYWIRKKVFASFLAFPVSL